MIFHRISRKPYSKGIALHLIWCLEQDTFVYLFWKIDRMLSQFYGKNLLLFLWKLLSVLNFAYVPQSTSRYVDLTYLHNPFRILAATMSVSFLQASLSLGTLSAACREIFKSSKILFYLLFFGWPGNQTKK